MGLSHRGPRQVFRLAFHFGLFQALLPLLSALAGSALERWIARWDHWLVFIILLLVGGRMAIGAISGKEDEGRADPTRGLSLVGLSLAVSIDAFAVGFTLGLSEVSIPVSVTIIGVVAALLTAIAMLLASRIAHRLGKRVELLAGLVLVALGCKVLLEHLR